MVIEGAGHAFREPEHRERATSALVGWFEEASENTVTIRRRLDPA